MDTEPIAPPLKKPRWRQWKTIVVTTLSVVLVVTLIGAWIALEETRPFFIEISALVAVVGVYPLTYLAYLGFRAKTHRQRLRDDFRLLGLVSEEDLDDTVDNLYQTAYSPAQFAVYIVLIMVLSLLVSYAYFNRLSLGFVDTQTMTLVFFGFLGAYLFSVQELIRRFNTFDLLPQVYSSIFVRMVVAITVIFVSASVILISGGTLGGEGANTQANPEAWATVIAFIIGMFPRRGIRWFVERTGSILESSKAEAESRPLQQIIGISAWHEARLAEMGIDDAQNLAAADIRRLLLTTQFDTQVIIHWIDQAILYVRVGRKLDRLRDTQITTFSELRKALQDFSLSPLENLPQQEIERRTEARNKLVATLGLSGPDELDRLADYSNHPNYSHIAEYYSRTAMVARQRAAVATEILIGENATAFASSIRIGADRKRGDFDEIKCRKVIESNRRLLPQNPDNPKLLLGVGKAYYGLNQLGNAVRAFTRAIDLDSDLAEAYYSRGAVFLEKEQYEDAVRDSSDAINIDPTLAIAFNNRGLAYMKMGYLDRALEDFNRALELDDRLAVAYLNRSVVYNALLDFEKAVRGFEVAYLLGHRAPTLWVGWGNALIALKDYEEAIKKLSQAVLTETGLATAYAKRGYAYLQRGKEFFRQARNDLETATNIDPSLLDAHSNLGLLEAKENNYESAISYYKNALSINSNHYITRYNLAIAYYKSGRIEKAQAEFERVTKIAPSGSFELEQSSYYLTMLIEEADAIPEKESLPASDESQSSDNAEASTVTGGENAKS